MSVARLAKTGASLLSGQGILVLTQLLLPPLFISHYGVARYGEWLTLAAAAQYLGTLNFGLHNFANNHVAIAYNRGDMDEVNVIQATSFAIVLGMVAIVAALASVLFIMPVSDWLHLTISSRVACATMYLLGLQLLMRMVFGFLQNAFLVIGAFHRGSNWLNVLSIVTLAVTAALVVLRASFVWIAASQAITTAAFTFLVASDLYIHAPVAFPKLQYTTRSRLMDILRPSGYFGMLFSVTFLVYQVPVVIMQRMLGPTNVVVFSITRTVYSMSRQALTSLSTALGPEITELFGRGNWAGLLRLYDLSERAVFALVPVVTLSTFLATPALMAVWVHKPALFQFNVCVYMALISAAAGIKEHKYQFQISINRHAEMARFLFFTYIGMVALMVPAVMWFGISGFLALWLVTEIVQILYIVKLNQRLFKHQSDLEMAPLYRIAAVLTGGMAAAWWIAAAIHGQPILIDLAVAALFGTALLAVEYPVFGLGALKHLLTARLLSRKLRQRQIEEDLHPVA